MAGGQRRRTPHPVLPSNITEEDIQAPPDTFKQASCCFLRVALHGCCLARRAAMRTPEDCQSCHCDR